MLRLENILSEHIINVLDRNDVNYTVTEQNGQYVAELQFYSNYDGEQIETVWFEKENSDESFAHELCGLFEAFDINEYVLMWLEAKRNRPNICPLNALQLIEDGKYIEDFLDRLTTEVYEALNGWGLFND